MDKVQKSEGTKAASNQLRQSQTHLYRKSLTVATEGTVDGHSELSESAQQLRQLERDCDQLTLKNNALQYELSKKEDEVRLSRSERTVFSQLFNQLEKELFDLELEYKVSVE
jgi:hypothetical protein